MAIKRKVKKPSVWLYPTAIERDYVYALDSLTDDLLAEVSQFCNQQEKFYRLHQDGIFDWLERVFNELLTSLMFYVSPHKVQKMVRKSLDETNQFNKQQFHKMLKKAYGVDIFTAENGLSDKLKLFELQNINLIKSIPTQLHEKLRYKFVEAVQKGKRWETLVDEVQELGQVTRNRARLIARDQIGKLNGQLTQIRQEEIGVKQYIWRTSLDERVRKLHVHREGEIFDWANPPDDGHPGEPIRCRCYAEAVLPTLDELVSQKRGLATTNDLYSKEIAISESNTMDISSLYQKATKIEPKITAEVVKMISSVGGKAAGLEYRLKSQASLQRKVEKEMLAGISEQQAVENIWDAIRYTAIFEPKEFVAKYEAMQKVLLAQGYKTILVKNSWEDNAVYKGINTFVSAFIEKDNVIFEMQYHTQESFELKNGELHKLYELFRDPATPQAEKEQLYLEMKKLSAKLTAPKDIQRIKGVK